MSAKAWSSWRASVSSLAFAKSMTGRLSLPMGDYCQHAKAMPRPPQAAPGAPHSSWMNGSSYQPQWQSRLQLARVFARRQGRPQRLRPRLGEGGADLLAPEGLAAVVAAPH